MNEMANSRTRMAGLLTAAVPLVAAAALASAPFTTSVPVAAPARTAHAIILSVDPCGPGSAGFHQLKLPNCASD